MNYSRQDSGLQFHFPRDHTTGDSMIAMFLAPLSFTFCKPCFSITYRTASIAIIPICIK